jgi:glutathione S-transferase
MFGCTRRVQRRVGLHGRDAPVARWNDIHKVVDWARYPRAKDLFDRTEQNSAVRLAHEIEDGEDVRSDAFQGHVVLEDVIKQPMR